MKPQLKLSAFKNVKLDLTRVENNKVVDTNEQPKPPPPPPSSCLVLPSQSSSSIIEDPRVGGISSRLAVGYAETIGRRPTMEDSLFILGRFNNNHKKDYFALFDGHNGDMAAKFCTSNLHNILIDMMEHDRNLDVSSALKRSFHVCNKSLKKVLTQGGTTAVVALFLENNLYVANAGDSRAVISREGKARRITNDHKPSTPEETERIIRAGGWINNRGVTGSLGVARALGDFGYYPYVTCEPDVFGPYAVLDSSAKYDLLIIACDGLWDVVEDDEAVQIALSATNPQEAALKLRDAAFNRESKDNISVMVIFFPHYVPPKTSKMPAKADSDSEESDKDSDDDDDDDDEDDDDDDDDEDSSSSSGSGSSSRSRSSSGSSSEQRESSERSEESSSDNESNQRRRSGSTSSSTTNTPQSHHTRKGSMAVRQSSEKTKISIKCMSC
eukprot:TRINITY_DN721_c4_g4_i4.p1 TRINITY_DN721_c4_g4~~TRINITY_DN721_c4_g4_i4.p1  ORF type:complete len:442 (-),score=136.78 TRINITY_DN721_c4_g4_i4:25-1350(-)